MSPTEDEKSHQSRTSEYKSEHRRFRRQYDPDDVNISKLFIAIREHNKKKISELIPKVRNINDVDKNDDSNTPLHVAVKKGLTDVVKLLLKNENVDINTKNERGDTALHLAATSGSKDLVNTLLEKGADVSLENNEDETPLDIAERVQNTDIVEALKQHLSNLQLTPIDSESRHNIEEKMSDYVKGYVTIYSAYMDDYYDILEKKLQKPGKWCDFIGEITATLSGGHEFFEEARYKATSMVGLSVIQTMVFSTSAWFKRKQLKKLIPQLILRKKNPEEMNRILVSSALDIFESYEAQLVQTTADNSWERAISKLADDAASRTLNYFKDNPDEEFSTFNAKKGIVLGSSKTYTTAFMNAPRFRAGHTVKNKYLKSWNTANMYEKTGIVVRTHGAPDEYYSKSKDSKTFGYRLLLDVDNLNVFTKELTRIPEPYEYVLNLDESAKERLRIKLSKEIDENNQNVVEMLQENLETMREEAQKDVDQLENTIGEHFDELMDYVSQNHNELRHTLRELNEQLARGQSEIIHRIDELQDMISEKGPKLRAVTGTFFDLREPSKSFRGRSEQLTEIYDILHDPNYKILVISGLRGVGKTALTLQFLEDFGEIFSNNVLWINAQNEETLKKSVFELAKRLKLKTVDQDDQKKNLKLMMSEIYQYFTKRRSKCVFVFDNAEKYERLKDVLPMNFPSNVIEPKIIITSTKSDWESESDHIKDYPLRDLKKPESVKFIKDALSEADIDNSHDEDIGNLADMLNNFPLTLREATSYIIEQNKKLKDLSLSKQYTVADYIKLYNTRTKQLLSSNILQRYKKDYDKNTYTSLDMSLMMIKSHELGAKASNILNILAYFSSDYVPTSLFLDPANDLLVDQLSSIVRLLKNFSIVEVDKKGIVVHGLIKQFLKIDLETNSENEKRSLREALNLLKNVMSDRETAKRYSSHIVSVWNYASKYDELIEEFVVNDLDGARGKFFHFIVEGSESKIVERVISKVPLEKLEMISNVKDKDGWTPLHLAAKSGRYDVVEMLIKNKAIIEGNTEFGFSPLHLAAKNGYGDIVRTLVEKGAKLNAKNRHEHTPLHFAVKNNHLDVVEYLLGQEGIDKNAEEVNGFTPLHYAVKLGYSTIVELLLSNDVAVDVETRERRFQPLHFAAIRGDLPIVQALVNRHADVDAMDTKDYTPLHFATKKNHHKVVEELLRSGASVNAKTIYWWAALHFAASTGNAKIVAMLLKSDANVNIATKDGFTPLHEAVQFNHKDIVDMLLRRPGIDLNLETSKGNTALHLAAEKGHLDIVKVLLENGASIAIVNDEGKLAKDMARDEETSVYMTRYDRGPANQLTYNKRRGTAGISGQLYEIKLSMYYLLEGLKRRDDDRIRQFFLASNHDDAEIFDDVVFKYVYGDQTSRLKYKTSFIQAKHKDYPDNPRDKITLSRLFSDADGKQAFSIKDYLTSYLIIKRRIENRELDDPIFNSRLEDCEFMIYTNALAHRSFDENRSNVEKVPIEPDHFLNLGATPHYYRLKLGDNEETKQEIINVLSVAADSVKLSKVLVKSIFQKNPPEITNPYIVGKYHVALSEKVIERTKGNSGKFRDSFIEGELSEKEQIFRKTFFAEMRRLKEFGNMPEEDLKFALRNKDLKLWDNFGKRQETHVPGLPSDVVDATVVEGFFRQLKLFVGQVSENDLTNIIKEKIRQVYKVENSDIDSVFAAIEYKMRNWWKGNDEYITEKNKFFQESARISYRFDVKEHMGLFTGRSRKLQELHTALGEEGKAVVVWGLGGVGKTELVRRYISAHNKDYDGNFIWINAENYNTFAESFTRLARDHLNINTKDEHDKQRDIEFIVREVYKFFSKRQSLFVFDNAARLVSYKERDGGVDRFLPQGPNKPRMIITSRDSDWGNFDKLNLNVFEEEEAWDFIRSAVTKKVYRQEDARILADELQYFPLALAEATAYIRIQNEESKQFTIKDYVEKYQSKAKELLNVKLDNDYTDTVFNTWAITVERIRDETCGEEALKILDSIAYFAPNNIPLDLALNLIDGDKPERKLRTATKLLDQYSMVQRDSGQLNVHRVIQQVTRIYLEEQQRERDVLDSALKAVTTSFDDKTYTSHAITAWESSLNYDDLITTYSNLPGRILEGLDKTSRFEEAFNFGKTSTDLLKQKLGLDNPDTLTALHNFGVVLESKGKYQDAYEVFNDVFVQRLKIYTYNNKDTLTTRNYMALELLKLGQHDKAFRIFDEVYKRREDLLGPHDADTLNSRSGRALALSHQGKYREAYKEFNEIYDLQVRSSGGEETQESLTILNDMAVVLEKQGQYQKAIELYRKVCTIREERLGNDHPSVLINRNNLGLALQKNEEYKESLEIYKDLVGRIQQVLGPEHPLALGTRNNMAIVLEKLGMYEEALQTYREVYQKIAEALSPDHPYALMTQNNIAGVLGTLGKHEEALEEYENAYDKLVVKIGKTHRSSLNTLNNIAYTYDKLGNHDEALRKYNEVIDSSMVELKEDHPDVLETKINIASVYFKIGQYDVALDILQATYEKFRSKGATLSSSASICRKKLGDTLKKLDRHAEAFQLYSDFYETTRAQQPDHREVSKAWEEMEGILSEKDVNDLRRNGESLLHWAVKNNFSDVVKLLVEKEVDVDALDADGKKAVELAGDLNIKHLLTVASCVAGSRGGRSKREARDCEVVDEKIAIDLEEGKDGKFANWLRGGKYSQLLDLASVRRSKFRDTLERINGNEKVMAHLNRVGIVSGIAMHGMMAKNAVADLLNGNYAGVAVNLGFIAGSQGFYRAARATSTKGFDMVSQGRLLLGRSLQSASPFLARGTSAFVTYDLVNQIKSYRGGDGDALVGIIGDGIYLGVDVAEIGVEVAEVFSIFEGVSSITGPVGAAIGAVVFVGTDVYSAIRRVPVINREIPLSLGERFVEGLRAFIGLHPGRLIEELLERKDLNNRLLANALQNLKRHGDIRRYVLPIGKIAKNCQNVPESKRICIAGGFGGCPRTRIVTRNVEKCKIEFTSEPNSTVLLDQKLNGLSWDRSVPDVPESSEMFCFHKGEDGSTPTRKSYLCENAMGITDLDPNKIDGYAVINLEDGDDTARGFNDSPNLFVVGNGKKWYHGGDWNDTFLLSGESTFGSLSGGNGSDTLDLTAFAPGEGSVETRFDQGRILLRNNSLAFSSIERFLGRKSGGDRVYVTCMEYLDGQGGGDTEGFEDYIHIMDGNCTYNIDVSLPENTLVQNHATNGSFRYNVPYSINGKSEVITLSAEADNSFSFQYSVTDITNMETVGNTTSFALTENFNVTISGARSYNYRFKDADILSGTKGSSYVLGTSNGTVESVITTYSHVASRLGNSSFVVHAVEPNEIIAIGNGNYIMTNDPSHTSHLVGNRGENIFVINPVDNSQVGVNVYNFNKERSINTVDLRKLNGTEVKVEPYGNDLLLAASGLTVKLKNGTGWYEETHVVLVDNPMTITFGNDGYYLKPQALVFDEGTEIILITDRDVEEHTEIITPRGGGAITFARNGNQLVLTNVFGGDAGKICTIVLSDFYTSSRGKMSTLCIKFAERKMCLKDYAKEIDEAKSIKVLKEEYNRHIRIKRTIKRVKIITKNPTIIETTNDHHHPPVTNSATIQSSVLTDALNWMKTKATSFLSNILHTTPPGVDSTTKIHSQHVDHSLFDLNSTLLLADVFLAKKTGRKIYLPRQDSDQSDSLPLAFNLWGIFEDSVVKSAQMAGIHEEELNIDYFVMKDVVEVLRLCIERGEFDNIVNVLERFAMEVCPVVGNDGFMNDFHQLVSKSVKDVINCGSNRKNVYKNIYPCFFNSSNYLNRDYRQYYLE